MCLLARRHPAPLGHEVIGNQMAYYYLQLMVKALKRIIKAGADVSSSDSEAVEKLETDLRTEAAAQPLPNNMHCQDKICKFLEGDRPKCAYSFLPKAMGPDVGDWMVNGTGPGKADWVNKGTGESPCHKAHAKKCEQLHKKHVSSGGVHALKKQGDSGKSVCQAGWPEMGHCEEGECVRTSEKCGYFDEKRGMFGQAGDRPLTLNVSTSSLWHGTNIDPAECVCLLRLDS